MTEARVLPFGMALNEALDLAMELDPNVFLLGEDIAERLGRAGGDDVDRIADRRRGGQRGPQPLLRARRQLGDVEPRPRRGIGGEDRRPARVADDRDARAGRQWLVRERLGDVEELFQRVDTGHAGLAEQGVDHGVR